jgi:hypothetical protein
LNLLWHRSRKEQRLSLVLLERQIFQLFYKNKINKLKFRVERNLEIGDYISDIFLEAHIDHTISLVEAKVTANIQRDELLIEHVDEASWCCHDYMHTS